MMTIDETLLQCYDDLVDQQLEPYKEYISGTIELAMRDPKWSVEKITSMLKDKAKFLKFLTNGKATYLSTVVLGFEFDGMKYNSNFDDTMFINCCNDSSKYKEVEQKEINKIKDLEPKPEKKTKVKAIPKIKTKATPKI